MGQTLGLVTAALQLGVQSILVKPKRAIGPFTAHVTLRETHVDELEITDQPVEQGSPITDHAYKRPCEVVIDCMWSDSPQNPGLLGSLAGALTGTVSGVQSIVTGNSVDQIRDTYQKLLALQASRIPFDVFTGKRAYRDMLAKTIKVETDKQSENTLRVTATLRQVIFATVSVVTVAAPKEEQADPESTMPTASKGVKQLNSATPRLNLSSAIDALTPSGLESVL